MSNTIIDPRAHDAVAHHLTQKGLQYRDEPFELRAGGESHWYVDVKRALSEGWLQFHVGNLAVRKAKLEGVDYSHVGAMGIGGYAVMFGMTIAALLDFKEDLKWTMAYEGEPNDPDNGLSGTEVNGQRIYLLDDVLSTGDSLKTTAAMIRAAGGEVTDALVLVTRSDGEVEHRLELEAGLRVSSLFTLSEAKGVIEPTQL